MRNLVAKHTLTHVASFFHILVSEKCLVALLVSDNQIDFNSKSTNNIYNNTNQCQPALLCADCCFSFNHWKIYFLIFFLIKKLVCHFFSFEYLKQHLAVFVIPLPWLDCCSALHSDLGSLTLQASIPRECLYE